MTRRRIGTLEELASLAGTEAGASGWLEVDQQRIGQFAETTEDRQWIHVDPERARRESPFGAPVAHGFLTLSLLVPMLRQAIELPEGLTAVNYGLNRVRFPAPVLAGSRIRARFTVVDVQIAEWGAQILWGVRVETGNSEKPCLVADWITRVYRQRRE